MRLRTLPLFTIYLNLVFNADIFTGYSTNCDYAVIEVQCSGYTFAFAQTTCVSGQPLCDQLKQIGSLSQSFVVYAQTYIAAAVFVIITTHQHQHGLQPGGSFRF